ncbi:hypothetical protein EJ04DRAFT_600748 [Polyplosphaeria fusca]|uniref:Fe2OG dioxygenase domain-containing protein n=1 Tax=Polyplosphaeria fusca TaxID=682080 RepID=A0A9P4R7H9_9PLEO|nr:hypothetical protein EJ04DRAFT_600748 [Polyplosphaeria fusca]
MAAVATQHVAALPRATFKPIIEHATAHQQIQAAVKFDPKQHLAFTPPSQILMMKDIGYREDTGISPVAVSQPFQLFSPEAIQQMRQEIFKKEVMENCSFRSNLAACQLRGYAPKYAPFTHDAWHSPETLAIISKIAGVDLVPWSEYEVAHINFSVKTDEQTEAELATINKQKLVGWHTDSYPFVCVLMLSDCTNMVGGETALRTGNGEVMKVRGPQEGCAVIMQGRYITHQALRALGAKERITAVTSFRPRSPYAKDDTELRTVRPISDLSELYYGFAEYRLEMLEERLRKERKEMMARRRARKKFDTEGHKTFLKDSHAFLQHTDCELVDNDKVVAGFIEEVDIPNVIVDALEETRPNKRARAE